MTHIWLDTGTSSNRDLARKEKLDLDYEELRIINMPEHTYVVLYYDYSLGHLEYPSFAFSDFDTSPNFLAAGFHEVFYVP